MAIDTRPVFIADTCIGGLSVVRSMWKSGSAGEVVFLADYAVNPLGVKSDSAIAGVVDSWLRAAAAKSDTLVIACNTLSIRYRQLTDCKAPITGLTHIVSMVDCFEALVKTEAHRMVNRKVLIIGTEFTAAQRVYPDILGSALPSTRIRTIGATDLERKIARLQLDKNAGDSLLGVELSRALGETDVAVLACTCFPMVQARLEALFPEVIFLDPASYCSGLLKQDEINCNRKLTLRVTGDVVSEHRVIEFAKTYLGSDSVVLL
ncbi:MAG: aspartate/glutamate racemase family protein [Lysobacterales bacterium]